MMLHEMLSEVKHFRQREGDSVKKFGTKTQFFLYVCFLYTIHHYQYTLHTHTRKKCLLCTGVLGVL